MAGPLDGLDLGAPDPTKKKPAAAPATDASGPLSGIDLSAPSPSAATKPATYDDTSLSGLAGDFAYRAANTGLLGGVDYANAAGHWLAGDGGYWDSLSKIQKENEEWGQAHPYLGLAADVAGYGLGVGKLGLGARLAERAGGSLLARAAGAGIENAGVSAVSDITGSQGQDLTSASGVGDLLKHAAIAGTVGAASGAIPGQKGAMADVVSPTKDLGTATETAFRPLEATHYDPSVIGPQFDAIKNGLAAKQTAGISDTLDTQIDKISRSIADKQKAGQSVTADDLTNFQIDINKAAQGSRDIGIAKAYDDGLDQTMANTKPLYSPLGTPTAISAQSDAARAAALQKKVSGDIDGWMTQAQKNPDAARESILKKTSANPGFYPGDVGDLLKQAGQPPGLVSRAAIAAAHPVADTMIGAGLGYMFEGQDLPTALTSAAIGGVAGTAARHTLAKAGANKLVNQLAAARHLNANPGQTINPSAFNQGAPGPLGPMATYAPQMGVGVGVSNIFGRADNPP